MLQPNNVLICQFWLKMFAFSIWSHPKKITERNHCLSNFYFMLNSWGTVIWQLIFLRMGLNWKYLLWLPYLYIYLSKEVRPKQNIVRLNLLNFDCMIYATFERGHILILYLKYGFFKKFKKCSTYQRFILKEITS